MKRNMLVLATLVPALLGACSGTPLNSSDTAPHISSETGAHQDVEPAPGGGPAADTGVPLTPEILIDRERYEEAARILRSRITTGGIADERIMAESTNMLGDCYLKMATGPDDLKKALFEYLKVVVLYGDVRDEYVRALRNSIRILEEIGGEEYKKKAADLREELKKTSQSPDNGPDKKE